MKRRNDLWENIDRIIKDYLAGKTCKAIAGERNCSTQMVEKLLHSRNVVLRSNKAKKLTDQDQKTVRTLYQSGMVTREIAERLGCNRHTVANYIRQWGIGRPRNERILSEQGRNALRNQNLVKHKQDIIALYENGQSITTLCNRYGCSVPTMSKMLKKNGIQIRIGGPKGSTPWNKGKRCHYMRGRRNWNWKGGRSGLNSQIRHCPEYRQWRDVVLKRDDYTCQLCGKRGGDMEIDHYPKSFASIMDVYRITSFNKALRCDEMWNPDNGRTLCLSCHNTTKNGNKRINGSK